MPSNFTTRFSATGGPLDSLHSEYAIASTYSDKQFTDVSCTVRLIPDMPTQMAAKSTVAQGEIQTGKALVKQSQIARPVIGGRFNVDGQVWEIQLSPVLKPSGQFECSVVRVNAQRRGERRPSNG